MKPVVFNYRVPIVWFSVVSVGIWCLLWWSGLLAAWLGLVPGVKSDEFDRLVLAGLVPLPFWAVNTLFLMNTRIEIQEGQIRWFDYLGRLKVQGSLATIGQKEWVSLGMAPGYLGRRYKLETEGGTITFFSSIQGFAELEAILEPSNTRSPKPEQTA